MADKNYEIKQDGYVAFDAISLKDLIIERMNQQQIFTDKTTKVVIYLLLLISLHTLIIH
jgi:hypothetical protein